MSKNEKIKQEKIKEIITKETFMKDHDFSDDDWMKFGDRFPSDYTRVKLLGRYLMFLRIEGVFQ